MHRGGDRAATLNGPRALVLDAHSAAGLETVQVLGRHGIPVDVADAGTCLAFHSRYARRKLTYPVDAGPVDLIAWLRALSEHEAYRLIVPSTEQSLRILQLADDDDPLRRKAVLPGRNSVDTALDKWRTWELAVQLGVPAPPARLLRRGDPLGAAMRFPVALKTLNSQVAREQRLVYARVCIARDEAQREAYLEEWLPHSDIQEQEYVSGHGWGIGLLYANGRMCWHFAHQRLHEWPLSGGAGAYRRAAAAPAGMLQAAQTLLDALCWHGVAMVEFRVNEAGAFNLLEINPRLWGSLPLSVRAGVNFPLGLWQLANGERLDAQPRYRVGYRMRSVMRDVEWMKENLFADQGDPLLLTRGRLRSAVEWFRPLLGGEGWDHFGARDPGVSLRLVWLVAQRYATALRRRLAAASDDLRLRRLHRRNRDRRRGRPRSGPHIVFVCHGNICRSPVAGQLAARRLPGCVIESAGLHEIENRETPPRIQRLAAALGVGLDSHRSRLLTDAQVAAADYLVLMDRRNFHEIERRHPAARDKVLFLGMFCSERSLNIADPYWLDNDQARASLERVAAGVDGLVGWVNGRMQAHGATRA